ncbi:MAG: hypothetical protein ACTSSJ_01280 [Candidatus Odinarchaeia archaeon]
MVKEIKPIEEDVDSKATRVFLKSIEILGGPRKLVEHRNLTWLPSLMTASYAVVYSNEKNYTSDKIANILGLTKQTVQNMLRADTEAVKARLSEMLEEEGEDKKVHVAGALAKLAYKEIKEGRDEVNIAIEITKSAARSLGADWAIHVLEKIRGTDFPIEKDTLKERLSRLVIMGKPVEDIVEKLEYPITTPAELLHKIKQQLA